MKDYQALYHQERIRFLQSQINSHFLYTTLESLRGMYAAGKDQAFRAAITQLATLYRYCAQPELTVPLEEEVRVAQAYHQLMCSIIPNEISLEWRIPRELTSWPVPRMLIQPLLENALIHGFLQSRIAEGTISIRAEAEGENLSLTVEDDGAGIPAEKILELNAAVGSPRSQIGFGNLKERIHLMYPETGSIEICSDGSRGATIEVRL